MICDVALSRVFKYYKTRKGPFLIIFYHDDITNKNFKLYEILKENEKYYQDIPILRFNYLEFIRNFPNENISNPNQLLIIEKNAKNIIFGYYDNDSIIYILNLVRNKLLSAKRKHSSLYKLMKKTVIRPWATYSHLLNAEEIRKYTLINAKIQYKFPNCTAFIKENANNNYSKIKSEINIQNRTDCLKIFKNSKINQPQTIKQTSYNNLLNHKVNVSKLSISTSVDQKRHNKKVQKNHNKKSSHIKFTNISPIERKTNDSANEKNQKYYNPKFRDDFFISNSKSGQISIINSKPHLETSKQKYTNLYLSLDNKSQIQNNFKKEDKTEVGQIIYDTKNISDTNCLLHNELSNLTYLDSFNEIKSNNINVYDELQSAETYSVKKRKNSNLQINLNDTTPKVSSLTKNSNMKSSKYTCSETFKPFLNGDFNYFDI